METLGSLIVDWTILQRAVLGMLCMGSMVSASELRTSAETAARWALTNERPQALADSLVLLLDNGGSLDAGDPFSAQHLIDGLRDLPGGAALADRVLSTRPRGQFGGAPRIDIELAPGAEHVAALQLVAGEVTWIEARLWRGAAGADIELELFDAGGDRLAAETGPETGVEGVGAILEVSAEACTEATLSVTNAGAAAGRVAILIPQSVRASCEDPG